MTITRAVYDEAAAAEIKYATQPGITEEVIREISRQKNEPEWLLKKRLQALKYFQETTLPTWGPDLSTLNLNEIVYYVTPNAQETNSWDEIPQAIKKTFERLGIPEAEKRSLSGVGLQFDSQAVYHNLKKEWEDLGVIFCNMDEAVHKYPEMVKKYFMTECVPINDHKFAMLHAAVWSGGTFIYVPPKVKVPIPLQAYFRMNAQKGGQFEHTLIIADKGAEISYIEGCSSPVYTKNSIHAGCVELFVHEGAKIKYSSIENWSKNTYNLNTKRALVDKNGIIEWINGNNGSQCTMLYPSSILRGEGAHAESLGVAFGAKGQNQDTGSKVVLVAPNTSAKIRAKSISKDGGITTYRGLVHVTKRAKNAKVSVDCDALILDATSVSNTYPYMNIENNTVSITHEAKVGKIAKEKIFYLTSRGLTEEQAVKLIVAGFVEPIVKQLPLEYAVELNKLIEMEMENSIG